MDQKEINNFNSILSQLKYLDWRSLRVERTSKSQQRQGRKKEIIATSLTTEN